MVVNIKYSNTIYKFEYYYNQANTQTIRIFVSALSQTSKIEWLCKELLKLQVDNAALTERMQELSNQACGNGRVNRPI